MFEGITAGAALSVLRQLLGELGIEEHEQFGTHDFRRGHAEDLRASGSSLPPLGPGRVVSLLRLQGLP